MFVLLHAYAALLYVQSFMTRSELRSFFVFAVAGVAGVVFCAVIALTWAGQSRGWVSHVGGSVTWVGQSRGWVMLHISCDSLPLCRSRIRADHSGHACARGQFVAVR